MYFKYYDPVHKTLSIVGHIYVPLSTKLGKSPNFLKLVPTTCSWSFLVLLTFNFLTFCDLRYDKTLFFTIDSKRNCEIGWTTEVILLPQHCKSRVFTHSGFDAEARPLFKHLNMASMVCKSLNGLANYYHKHKVETVVDPLFTTDYQYWWGLKRLKQLSMAANIQTHYYYSWYHESTFGFDFFFFFLFFFMSRLAIRSSDCHIWDLSPVPRVPRVKA